MRGAIHATAICHAKLPSLPVNYAIIDENTEFIKSVANGFLPERRTTFLSSDSMFFEKRFLTRVRSLSGEICEILKENVRTLSRGLYRMYLEYCCRIIVLYKMIFFFFYLIPIFYLGDRKETRIFPRLYSIFHFSNSKASYSKLDLFKHSFDEKSRNASLRSIPLCLCFRFKYQRICPTFRPF